MGAMLSRYNNDAAFLPNGLATVASLNLPTHLASGFGPAGPPSGLLEKFTYSVQDGRLYICLPEDIDDVRTQPIHGVSYKAQPVVGSYDGKRTRPADYITWSHSSHPFVPGHHPLKEAVDDEREVRTNWFARGEKDL